MLEEQHFSDIVCRELGLNTPAADLSDWQQMLERIANRPRHTRIAIVGKYVQFHDAYLSVMEALKHGGYANGAVVDIDWIDSEYLTEDNYQQQLAACDGILVPGGFGDRGIEGMILAARYAREHDKPYLGICLGMQIAVIEFARHVCGIADAHSGEFAPQGEHKVIDFMPGQNEEIDKGALCA